jgi:outer membrane scaffolding protein for murein synthesis (MipA/OmpV family)
LLAASPGEKPAGLSLALGLGPFLYPSYPGGKVYRVLPFPYIEGGYGELVGFELLDGLRLNLLRRDGFSAGPMARYRWGRTSHDSLVELQGLRRVNDTIELGGFVSYIKGPLYLDLSLTQDVLHGHGGAVAEAWATLSLPLAKGLGVEFGPFLRAASQRYTQAYFGIDAQQSAANGKPAYNAAGGLERGGLQVAAQLDLAPPGLSLRGQTEIARLLGSAAQSPITRQGGSRMQVYSGLFLVWQFR